MCFVYFTNKTKQNKTSKIAFARSHHQEMSLLRGTEGGLHGGLRQPLLCSWSQDARNIPDSREGRDLRDKRGVLPSPGLTSQFPETLCSKDLSAPTPAAISKATPGSGLLQECPRPPGVSVSSSLFSDSCLSTHSLCDLESDNSLPPAIFDPLFLVLPPLPLSVLTQVTGECLCCIHPQTPALSLLLFSRQVLVPVESGVLPLVLRPPGSGTGEGPSASSLLHLPTSGFSAALHHLSHIPSLGSSPSAGNKHAGMPPIFKTATP